MRVQVKNITGRDYIRRSTEYAALWNAGMVAAETAPSGSRFQTGIIRTKNAFLYVSPVLPMWKRCRVASVSHFKAPAPMAELSEA